MSRVRTPGPWYRSCSLTGSCSGEPGTALDDTLTIACGEGAVRLVKLQREGKGAMMAEDFLRGTTVPAGTVLG